ncbi:MAG: hypothetical protein KIT34_02660 [Cyanobacteria bacterium TGS_CYA1]|nr:hypothetical protein [Cyanobacteria bacterium TGS_CYA1]
MYFQKVSKNAEANQAALEAMNTEMIKIPREWVTAKMPMRIDFGNIDGDFIQVLNTPDFTDYFTAMKDKIEKARAGLVVDSNCQVAATIELNKKGEITKLTSQKIHGSLQSHHCVIAALKKCSLFGNFPKYAPAKIKFVIDLQVSPKEATTIQIRNYARHLSTN